MCSFIKAGTPFQQEGLEIQGHPQLHTTFELEVITRDPILNTNKLEGWERERETFVPFYRGERGHREVKDADEIYS